LQVKEMRFRAKYTEPALTIQSYFRGWQVRKITSAMMLPKHLRGQGLSLQSAVLVIQSHFRGWRARQEYQREKAARVIQSHFRGYVARQFFTTLRATVTIQSFFRGWKVRHWLQL
jgi:hypothetical protein